MKEYQKIPLSDSQNESNLTNTNLFNNDKNINFESNKLTITTENEIHHHLNYNTKKSKKDDKSHENKKRNQKLFFYPFCTTVFTLSAYFWSNYFVYRLDDPNLRNKEYYWVWFIYFFLELTYILSTLTIPKQTNIEKYFNMNNDNQSNSKSKQINFLNEEHWYLNCEFCKKKKFYKSSHCRMCKTCIIFRDHHCPWIANCVGYQNIQYFMNLIIWGSIGTTFYMINFVKFCNKYKYIKENYPQLNLSWIKIVMFLIIFVIDLYMDFNNFLLFFNINNAIFNNLHTIENIKNFGHEYYFLCNIAKNDKNSINNKFNVGFFLSYYYLIGPTILHYIFPLPKFNNLPINECSPLFNKIKYPHKLYFYKEIINIDNKYTYLIVSELNDPNNFIELCHKYYDEEKIKLIK